MCLCNCSLWYVNVCVSIILILGAAVDNLGHPSVATRSLKAQRLFISIAISSLFYKQFLNCAGEREGESERQGERERKICDDKHGKCNINTIVHHHPILVSIVIM